MDALNTEFARLLANSGWSQSEAARQLKVSPALITRYLNGETRPSLTTLKLFKVMLGDEMPLPGEGGHTMGDQPRPVRPMSAHEKELMEAMRQLPEPMSREVAKRFQELARIMAEGQKGSYRTLNKSS